MVTTGGGGEGDAVRTSVRRVTKWCLRPGGEYCEEIPREATLCHGHTLIQGGRVFQLPPSVERSLLGLELPAGTWHPYITH